MIRPCITAKRAVSISMMVNRTGDFRKPVCQIVPNVMVARIADTAIAAIIARSDLIYLTICLDVLPHYQAPGVSAAAIRGVPLTVIEYLISHILDRCAQMKRPIPVTDIVELSPPHDQNQVTARTAAIFARQLLFS